MAISRRYWELKGRQRIDKQWPDHSNFQAFYSREMNTTLKPHKVGRSTILKTDLWNESVDSSRGEIEGFMGKHFTRY